MLIPTGFLAAFSALGIRTLWRHSPERRASSRGDLIMDILLGTSLPVLAAALSLPGTNAWGLACFWLVIAAYEIWAWAPSAGQWLRQARHEKTGPEQFHIDQAQSVAAHIEPVSALPGAISALTPGYPLGASPDMGEGNNTWTAAKGVTQQLTRSTTAQGGDLLCGALRLDFAAGQRTGNLHVAFCPPFAGTPEITAEQADGPEARIKIAQLLPYGVRMDVKLVVPSDEPAGVLVQFSARREG
ncbi:MAG: hypothetical protein ABSE63_13335 [Thermoguttaceae bacterium]|jgi:hypothetical protein